MFIIARTKRRSITDAFRLFCDGARKACREKMHHRNKGIRASIKGSVRNDNFDVDTRKMTRTNSAWEL